VPCATTAIILLNVRLPGRRISVTAQEQAASVPVLTMAAEDRSVGKTFDEGKEFT